MIRIHSNLKHHQIWNLCISGVCYLEFLTDFPDNLRNIAAILPGSSALSRLHSSFGWKRTRLTNHQLEVWGPDIWIFDSWGHAPFCLKVRHSPKSLVIVDLLSGILRHTCIIPYRLWSLHLCRLNWDEMWNVASYGVCWEVVDICLILSAWHHIWMIFSTHRKHQKNTFLEATLQDENNRRTICSSHVPFTNDLTKDTETRQCFWSQTFTFLRSQKFLKSQNLSFCKNPIWSTDFCYGQMEKYLTNSLEWNL